MCVYVHFSGGFRKAICNSYAASGKPVCSSHAALEKQLNTTATEFGKSVKILNLFAKSYINV
jgi:hypothetical protein